MRPAISSKQDLLTRNITKSRQKCKIFDLKMNTKMNISSVFFFVEIFVLRGNLFVCVF
jgi:hypothetical protein